MEATGSLIGNKTADQITRASKHYPKNISGTNEDQIPREKYISPKLGQKVIDDLRLREENF